MRLRTLGGPALEGRAYRRRKALLLLGYLSVEGPCDRRLVADLFWPTAVDRRNSLAKLLSQLRSELPGAVEERDGALLCPLETDLADLLAAIDAGEVERARALYTAPPFGVLPGVKLGVELEEWVERTREFVAGRLRTLLLERALERAAGGALDEAGALGVEALDLAGAAPLEAHQIERLHPILVLANRSEAGGLRAEAAGFGLALTPTLDDARAALDEASGRTLAPALLPRRGGAFVGREREVADLTELIALGEDRLIALVGPGGVGKTRLALEVVQRRAAGSGGAMAFVDLAPLEEASALPWRVAEAFGLAPGESEEPLALLAQTLGGHRALLLLDNLEHLPDAITHLKRLRTLCPGLLCLVTSRTRTHLMGERAFALGGLPYPDDARVGHRAALRYPAVQLFVDRARRARRDFALDDDSWPSVHAICRLVEGLPLALELAAGWLRLLEPAEVEAELRRGIDILTSESRDLPERQRSVRATLEHSWRLLDPRTRRGLAQLAVFVGGFDREAAARVAGADLALLARLVDASLLRPAEGGRFDLHGLIVRFGLERLEERPDDHEGARRRHAHHVAAWIERARGLLNGSEQRAWLGRFEREHDNLRAALHWAVEVGDTGCALRLVVGAGPFWRRRSHFVEGRRWLDEVLALPGIEAWPLLVAGAHAAAGDMARRLDGYAAAGEHYRRALTLYREVDDPAGEAVAVMTLGIIAAERGEMDAAHTRFTESLELERRLGRRRGVAAALSNLATIAELRGDYDGAERLNEESLAIKRAIGDDAGVAASLGKLGLLASYRGDYDEAERRFEDCLATERRLGDRANSVLTLNYLGALHQRRGDDGAAQRLHAEAEALAVEVGDKGALAETLDHLARIALRSGDLDGAEARYRRSLELGRTLGSRAGIATASAGLGRLALVRGDLDRARERLLESLDLRRALGERAGVAASLQLLGRVTAERGAFEAARAFEAEALALRRDLGDRQLVAESLIGLGRLDLRQGRWDEARRPLIEAAALGRDLGAGRVLAGALSGLAEAALGRGDAVDAVRLWGAASRLHDRHGFALGPLDERAERLAVAAARDRLDPARFEAAWREGREGDPDRLVAALVALGEGDRP